jgi:hypothetical protein
MRLTMAPIRRRRRHRTLYGRSPWQRPRRSSSTAPKTAPLSTLLSPYTRSSSSWQKELELEEELELELELELEQQKEGCSNRRSARLSWVGGLSLRWGGGLL